MQDGTAHAVPQLNWVVVYLLGVLFGSPRLCRDSVCAATAARCQAAERRRDMDAERQRIRDAARAAQSRAVAATEARRKEQLDARIAAKDRELANDGGWGARQDLTLSRQLRLAIFYVAGVAVRIVTMFLTIRALSTAKLVECSHFLPLHVARMLRQVLASSHARIT